VVYTFGIAGEALWDRDPELSDIDFSMEALCVDRNTVGGSIQDVKKTVGPSGELHVHRFWMLVELEEFFQLFKRFQVSFPNVGRANAGKAFSGCITKVVDDETFLQRDD
jgi:hypothetical protein